MMSKGLLRLVLTFILTVFLLNIVMIPAGAEDVAAAPSTATSEPESGASLPTEGLSEPLTTEPETVSLARYPVLTVNAISNYFGKAYAEYNEFTREVTVTYLLKASKRILSTNWKLTYDPQILSVDPEKNKRELICPIMKDDCALFFGDGEIRYAATDLKMFDFTTKESPFVQITFDVAQLTELDSEITKVDLSVEDLWVSEPNPATGESVREKEIVLVANSKVIDSKLTDSVLVSKITSLTKSTFVEPSYDSTPDQAFTTVPAAPVTTSEAVTEPVPTELVRLDPEPGEKDGALIQTGEWYVALLILGLLFICSLILFIMRKRDIYNNP